MTATAADGQTVTVVVNIGAATVESVSEFDRSSDVADVRPVGVDGSGDVIVIGGPGGVRDGCPTRGAPVTSTCRSHPPVGCSTG